MEITICSDLDGDASGYIVLNIPSNYSIGSILKLYCGEKGIEVADDYVLCGKGNTILDPDKTLEEEGICSADIVTLTHDDKEQLFAFGSWWVISLIAFLIGSTGFIYTFYLYYFPQQIPQKYGLVIDAGSTHSQLFVFSWSMLERKGTADVELIHDCVMSGGVASFRSHTQDLHEYFSACIAEAEDLIPISVRPNTPLILAATAGMRILRAYDPEGASLVLSSIREIFWSNTLFHTRHRDVFVASGQQEGINGWAALNYLLENFEETENESQASALDLGGASVQVTTELSKEAILWPTVNITLFNNTYSIFSKSFLCYGIGEAKHRYQYLLVSDFNNKSSNVIHNPCLPKGFQTSFTSEDFYNPCIFSNETKISSFNFPSKYSKRFVNNYLANALNSPSKWSSVNQLDKSTTANVTLTETEEVVYILAGTSDTHLCRERVEDLFDYELCEKNFVLGDCLNKKVVPPYKGELVGFSSIFFKLLPLLGVSQEGSLHEFQNAVLSICSMSSKELTQLHSNISMDMIEDICFDGMYVYTLLKEGLGITPQGWKNILFTNKVHEQDVVWAMGLMLNRTSQFKPEVSSERIDAYSFCLLLIMFSMFLVISFMFSMYAVKLKQRGNAYQRVSLDNLDP